MTEGTSLLNIKLSTVNICLCFATKPLSSLHLPSDTEIVFIRNVDSICKGLYTTESIAGWYKWAWFHFFFVCLVFFSSSSSTSDYNWANCVCYFNRKLDRDQTAWGQWNGLFWDYSIPMKMAYHAQGWTKSTSHRGITTNGALQCRNRKRFPHLNKMMKSHWFACFSKLEKPGCQKMECTF